MNSMVRVLIIGLLFTSGAVFAQDEDYELVMTDASGPWEGEATTEILLTSTGDDISAYQWGACHEDGLSIEDGDVVDGAGIADILFSFKSYSFVDGGYTAGGLLDVISGAVIGMVEDLSLAEATYTLPEEDDSDEPDLEYCIDFCDDLGVPEVPTAVIVNNEAVTPVVVSGCILIVDPRPWLFTAPTIEIQYRPDIFPIDDVVVELTILEDPEVSEDYPQDAQGFSMGLGHDGAVVTPLTVEPIGPLPDLNNGDGPEFFGVQIDDDEGITVGCVFVALSDDTLEFDEETEVVEVTYEVLEDAIFENEVGNDTALFFRDDLGVPAVVNRVSVGGFGQGVEVVDGSITFIPILQTPFVRGDCNSDERIDMADGIHLLDFLFREDPPTVTCLIACNINRLEEAGVPGALLGIPDALYLFNYLFTAGPEIGTPFPDCDISDLTYEEDLCETFLPCE